MLHGDAVLHMLAFVTRCTAVLGPLSPKIKIPAPTCLVMDLKYSFCKDAAVSVAAV